VATILVIDDDDAVRGGVRRLLERSGHVTIEAAEGRKALLLCEAVDVDLVITDLNMPEMDGIEVIMALAERRPGLPVIAISGGGKIPKELLLHSAGLLGAVTTLAKPFELLEIRDVVEKALASRRPGGDSTTP
jgi:DNA-binding NtrC family response regulator